jgi:hypothetical protein
LGRLELFISDPKKALEHFRKACELYRAEQKPMGLALSLVEMIRCHRQLGTLDTGTLKELASEALIAAVKSGLEPVIQYVREDLFEACDEDEEKLKALLDSLGFGS